MIIVLILGIIWAVILFALLIYTGFISLPVPGSSFSVGGIDPKITAIMIPTMTNTPFQPLPTFTSTSTPTITPTPTRTSTPTNTFTPTKTFTSTSTKTPFPTRTPKPTNKPNSLPAQASIHGIVGHAQSYNLDCESRSATDLAAFFGIRFNEMDFQSKLPKSDDPSKGFVGSYKGTRGQIPPNSYGVYAPPVAKLLRNYGLTASDVKNFSWNGIRNEIAAGRPVMAWVVGDVWPGTAIFYTASDGNTVQVVHFEHTVIVIGYDQQSVTILDGDTTYSRSIQEFTNSWSVLGNMAIIVH
ncbi:MAG TPA: C39 family peptidase [Anaerolineaceae bacterium]|nr:C39 family peptidase [Anaerolineaceae bacterium]